METHKELKKKANKLIGDNKTDKAIQLLEEQDFPSITKELIVISGRHSKVTEEQRMGISTEEDIQRKFNKINFDLIALIEMIGKKPIHNTNTSTSAVNTTGTGDGGKSNSTKYFLIIGGVILAILAGFAIMHLMEDPGSQASADKPTVKTLTPGKVDKNPIAQIPPDTIKKAPPTTPPKEVKKIDYTKYKVGQEFGGGIIFYKNPEPTEGRGLLIMATIDLPEDEVYWLKNGVKPKKTGANRKGLFSGKINTKDIVEKFKKEYPDESNPAKLCDEFIFRNIDDWYLPSQMELDLLYNYYIENKKITTNNFVPKYYWSSTEIYYRSFHNGKHYTKTYSSDNFDKQNKAKVRAIRSL